MRLVLLAAGTLTAIPATGVVLAADQPPASPTFEKDVLPVFQAECLRCHGAAVRKAGLDLRTKAGMLQGGESGPALTAGKAETSMLWEKVAADQMPPGKVKLTAAEKALLRAWIDQGAKGDSVAVTTPAADAFAGQVSDADRQFWSFRPPIRPPVPTVRGDGPLHPVDAFLLAALRAKGLTFSPEADRAALLRRVTFDLTGLPPTPAEVEAFLADRSPDAYERLIDRLLASPQYGERWGRHWLDLAGYADSEGILDADYVRTHAWRYRDWVVRAVNRDMPYDQFLREQLAGDELSDYWAARRSQKQLPPQVVESLVATGYLRCASDTSRPDFVKIKNAPGYYYQTLDDTVKIVASSVLGLTVQCAKCHSHKYDPIPQSDYYRLQAVFMSAYRPYQWVPQVQRRLLEATEAQEKEAAAHNAAIDAAVAPLRKQLEALTKQFAGRLFDDGLAKLPAPIRDDVRAALNAEPAKRTPVQKYLAGKFEGELRPDANAQAKVLPGRYPDYKAKKESLDKAVATQEAKRRTFPEIRALYDLPGEAKTPLLRRGDYLSPGPAVSPGVLAALTTPKPFQWTPPAPGAPSSGRRRAFAEWLTQPGHPLTARVLVNRLWLHHFGAGLVATPDNFGRTGAPPSHPELLDWLATEFVVRGWSMKVMHRLLLTTRAYRQASAVDPASHAAAQRLDPDNRLVWRQRFRRLEAEAIRDTLLRVAGTLNPLPFGPPVAIQRDGDGEVQTANDATGRRRSIYLQVRRSQPITLLQVFDQPVMETNCTLRGASTVSSQALSLLNSELLTRQAAAFAERVQRESPNDPAGRAVMLAFGRPATAAEQTELAAFLDTQAARHVQAANTPPSDARRRALADLCHMLVSANEFIYLD